MLNNKELTKADEFINQGLKEIDKEVQDEDELKAQAIYITELLEKNPVVRVEFKGELYTLSRRVGPKQVPIKDKDKKTKYIKVTVILLAVVSDKKRREAAILNKHVKPALYEGEYNDEFTLKENLVAVTEAFLRNITGELKVEEVDDGIAKVVREKDLMK